MQKMSGSSNTTKILLFISCLEDIAEIASMPLDPLGQVTDTVLEWLAPVGHQLSLRAFYFSLINSLFSRLWPKGIRGWDFRGFNKVCSGIRDRIVFSGDISILFMGPRGMKMISPKTWWKAEHFIWQLSISISRKKRECLRLHPHCFKTSCYTISSPIRKADFSTG